MRTSRRASIRVVVVGDVRFYRDALAEILPSTDGIAVVGTAAGSAEGLRLVSELRPDVVLLDVSTAGGVSTAQRLADAVPDTKIVALDVPQEEADLIGLVEAGVLGYVTGEQSLDAIASTVVSVVRDEMVCSPKMRTLVVKRMRALAAEFSPPVRAALTAREFEILDLIAEGLSNKEIARELGIESATVKNHVHNILEKLQVQTRMAAVAHVRLWARPRAASAPTVAAVAASP